jgi:hypothetical protein
MVRLLLLVEGQTEENFAKQVLAPHLAHHGVYAKPTLTITKPFTAGGGHRGGVRSWGKLHNDLRRLLNDTNAWVTTIIDFYGFPKDFPGFNAIQGARDALGKAELLENQVAEHFNHSRFIPFLALHEFEAWIFSSPETVAKHFDCPDLANDMERIIGEAGSPEQINQGENTHPKMRLMDMVNKKCQGFYKETSEGPTLMKKIGIDTVRTKCPHFNAWLTRLESLDIGTQ